MSVRDLFTRNHTTARVWNNWILFKKKKSISPRGETTPPPRLRGGRVCKRFSAKCSRLSFLCTGPFATGMDRRHRILLRGVHTPVENGRHRVRVQREGRGQLRGLCAHLLVYILQLDHIRLLYGQRRYVTRRLNVGATKSRASGQMREN